MILNIGPIMCEIRVRNGRVFPPRNCSEPMSLKNTDSLCFIHQIQWSDWTLVQEVAESLNNQKVATPIVDNE